MTKTKFVYVTYIAAPRERIFEALIKPEFTRAYWEHENVSDWKAGSKWEHRTLDGSKVEMTGKVIEFDRPNRLVISWVTPQSVADPDQTSRVTLELADMDGMVQLTVTHDELESGSKMQQGIERGWPRVIASLKSLLETGKPLPTWAKKEAARS